MGCEPKPQHLERTRVVGVNTGGNGGTAGSKARSHHFKGHRGRHHATADEKVGNTEKAKNKALTSPKDFKLWADGPNFDTNLRQNVVALVGRTAYLTCRVFDRGNKTVGFFNIHFRFRHSGKFDQKL